MSTAEGQDDSTTLHRKWLVALFVYLLVLAAILVGAYLGRIPTRGFPFRYFDTLGHFVLIGTAALLLDLAWRSRKSHVTIPGGGQIAVASAALVVAGLAMAEEIAQLLSADRTFDLVDLGADIAGAVFFCWCAEIVRRRH